MEERRSSARVPESQTFGLAGGPLPPGAVATVKVVDLSASGIGFESNFPLPVGPSIELNLPAQVKARATIVRAQQQEGAVRYGGTLDGIEPEGRSVLRTYLNGKLQALGLEPLPQDKEKPQS